MCIEFLNTDTAIDLHLGKRPLLAILLFTNLASLELFGAWQVARCGFDLRTHYVTGTTSLNCPTA